jgi:MYXO-CTERM domain-containing protein
MANETMFDPFAFAAPLPAVRDTTDEVEVFRYDALGGIIPVPGVGGGINVVLVGELEAEYSTVRIVVADAPLILGEAGMTLITPPTYGPALDSISHPEGNLHYRGQIVIRPSLYLSFAGTRETFPIAEIPVPILDRDAEAIFGDETTHVPLPDIRTDAAIDFGLVSAGVRHEQYLTLANDGEMELVVSELVAEGDFAAVRPTVTVPPRSTARVAIGFYSLTPGPHASVLRLETNDPDAPSLEVALHAMIEGTEFPPSDAGVRPDAGPPLAGLGPIDDGGCGCRTGEPSALALLLFLLIPVFRRRL